MKHFAQSIDIELKTANNPPDRWMPLLERNCLIASRLGVESP
jgi:hypothetical protein